MAIDRLRYFSAVVETKNLRKASELVGISPPSMSKAISVLESELGCKLIHSEGRGIGITPDGMDVYRQALPLLEEYRKFYRNLRTKSGNRPTAGLRMATFEVFSTYFLSSFFAQERAYEISLLEMTPGKIEQAVLSGTVDFGITYIPSLDPKLEYQEIGSFRMGIFGRKEWASKDFHSWPFAVPITELKILTSEIDSLDLWPKTAPKRHIPYRFELLETALQTSRQGLSVLHCPDFIIGLHNEQVRSSFQLSPLPPPPDYKPSKPIRIYLVGKKGSDGLRLEGKLAKFIRSIPERLRQPSRSAEPAVPS